MERSIISIPVPELVETNLNHSFKINSRDDPKRKKRPPKLYPKELNLLRNSHREAHAISFRESCLNISSTTSTPKSKTQSFDLSSSFYDKKKNETYFEQCFETIKKIGEGSFGEVFKVRSRDDGNYYAVKKMRYIHRSGCYRKERMEEVRRYEEFSDNNNCVTFYKAWEQDDSLYMQIELCRESVQDFVEKVQHVSETFIWSFLLDMLLALKSLHDKNLIHLDIKLDNILITDDHHCKLADFGLIFDVKNSNRSRAIEGDSRYLAPELMRGNYCLANDIFSLGITLLELACNLELPANGTLWQELRSGVIPDFAMRNYSRELQKIIRYMMEPDPVKRPDVNRLLSIPKLKFMMFKKKTLSFAFTYKGQFIKVFQFFKQFFLMILFFIFDFFTLRSNAQKFGNKPVLKKVEINVQNMNENSDDENSFKTSINNSLMSKISATDDDNNNESNVTPTLNNSIPRVTPELKIINSTPLNHYNHQHESLSNRKYRKDLTKSCFEVDDGFCSPVIPRNISSKNSSHDRDSFICSKKLLFHDEDLENL